MQVNIITLNYTPVVSHADSPPGTPIIEITFKDSSGDEQKIDAIDLKNKVLRVWEELLGEYCKQ